MGLEWEGAAANCGGGTSSPDDQDVTDHPVQHWQGLALLFFVDRGKVTAS